MSPENKDKQFDLPPEISVLPQACQEEVRAILAVWQDIQLREFEIIKSISEELKVRGIETVADMGKISFAEIARLKQPKGRTLAEIKKIIPAVCEDIQGMFDGFRPFQAEVGSWEASVRFSDMKVANLLQSTKRMPAFHATKLSLDDVGDRLLQEVLKLHPLFRGRPKGSALLLGVPMFAMGRALLKDLRPEENPYLHLLEIQKLGGNVEFFERVGNKEKLTAHLLLSMDGKTMFACISLGDGEAGEIKTIQVHDFGVDCRKNPDQVQTIELPDMI